MRGGKLSWHDDRETTEEHLNIVDKLLVLILAVSYEYILAIDC